MKNKTRRIGWALIIPLLVILPMTAAVSAQAMGSKGGQQPPSSEEKLVEGKMTIREILKNPARYVDREIVLEGVFQGWKGKCEESSSLTRSDWIMKDDTGCIFISGRIPSGVSTVEPKGERLILSGILKIKEGGKPYIEAKEVRLNP